MIKGFGAEPTATYSQTSNISGVLLTPVIASMVPQNNDMVRKLKYYFQIPTIKRLTALKMPKTP
jgi:hypothetical protein